MVAWIRGRGSALAVVIVALLLTGITITTCRAPEARTLPPPSNTGSTEATTTTSDPDHSRIALPAIEGQTTTTGPIATGNATLRGVVQGPDGPVADAIVRAERLVGDIEQRLDVRTGADGTFSLDQVPGGRYRVRAFLPPTLAMEEPEIFFHPDGEVRDLRLTVEEFGGLVVRSDSTPPSPVVGGGVNLAVRVAERQVDGDGVIREVPLAGVMVRVDVTGWTAVADGSAVTTGSDGMALFEYRCERPGPASATAVVGAAGGEESTPLDVPGCAPAPTTTTTTTTEPDDSTSTSSSTTTTR